jgi:MoaA/NifB/PqqE/SkfB family radical SAM enzyme
MKPRLLQIYLTNRCNSNCKSCNVKQLPQDDTLSITNIIDAVEQYKNMGGRVVTLTGGEPLLRKDIFDIIHALSDFNLNINICTNGISLNKEFVDKIASIKRLRIIVSLDSLNRERYKLLRGVDALNLVLKNIDYLRENVAWKVRIFTTFNEINFAEWKDLLNYAKKNNLFFSGHPYFSEDTNIFYKHDESLVTRNFIRPKEIFNHLARLSKTEPYVFGFSKYYRTVAQLLNGKVTSICGAGSLLLQLTPDNNLRPCNGLEIERPMDRYTMVEIINNEEWKQDIKLCKHRKQCALSCAFSPFLVYKNPLLFTYESIRSKKFIEYLKMILD